MTETGPEVVDPEDHPEYCSACGGGLIVTPSVLESGTDVYHFDCWPDDE